MKRSAMSPKPLECTLYLCLVADRLVRPGGVPGQVCPQVGVLSIVLQAAMLLGILRGLTYWGNAAARRMGGLPVVGRAASGVTALLLCAGAGYSAAATLLFLNLSVERRFSAGLFLFLLIALAIYAARMGTRGILRAGEILFILFCVAIGLIFASNVKNASVLNLTQSALPLRQTLAAALRGFAIPLALPAAQSMLRERDGAVEARLGRVILAACATAAVFEIGCALVLGQMAATEGQPLYLLAKVGSLSVFRRLAPACSFIFMILLAQKTAFLLAGAYDMFCGMTSDHKSVWPAWGAAGLSLAAGGWFLSCDAAKTQVFLSVGAAVCLLLIPIVRKGEAVRTAKKT